MGQISRRTRRATAAAVLAALALWPTLPPTLAYADESVAPSGPAAGAGGEGDVPPPPAVADPMLEPIPEAPNVLASWKEAIALVRQRSTALRVSRAQIAQARARSRMALAGALPSLRATAGVNRHLLLGEGPTLASGGRTVTVPDPATTFGAGLELRQPLLALGAWRDHGTAQDREEVTVLTAKDTERLLLGAVAEAAVTVITAARVAEASRVALGSALSTLDLTRRRADLGAGSAVDVLRAEQEVSQSRAQVVSTSEALRQAREALGVALGDVTPWAVSPAIRVEDLVRTTGEICQPLPSLDARSDVRAARQSLDVASRDARSVDYTYAPTIDLVSGLDYSSVEGANRKHVGWTVGGFLSWSLYDGGLRYGQKDEREATVTIAREELTQKRRDAAIEVAQSERGIAVAEANLAVSKVSRDLAEKSARLARIAFTNGSGTSFDLVDNARRLREAEIDLLIRDFEVVKARITAFLARANCSI